MLSFYNPIFIWFIPITLYFPIEVHGYQSLFSLSASGKKFFSENEQVLLVSNISTNSSIECLQACHANVYCRVFDYDGETNQCRLFEGDVSTMGIIDVPSSLLSIVGWIQLKKEAFISRGGPCHFCVYERNLICRNSTCQCLARTYFDGSICRSQKLLGDQCTSETDCRNDVNLTCLSRKQCGPLIIQSGITVGGYSNGLPGLTNDALSAPFGVVVDQDGSLLVSDASNARIMRLYEGSIVGTVVAGTGIAGNESTRFSFPSHLFIDNASNVYVGDTLNGRVMLWLNGSSSGVSVTGSTRILGRTIGVAVDSQKNVYVAETDNHRVTKWAPNATSGIVVAGTGISGMDNQHLSFPFGLYLDEVQSYLYVADYGNNRIQRFTLGISLNGTTVAGGNGYGSNDNQLSFPQAICVSKKTGAIYIADTFNNRIARWNAGATSGATLVGITGMFGTNATFLYGPGSVTLNKNETYLYVADLNNNRIQRFTLI